MNEEAERPSLSLEEDAALDMRREVMIDLAWCCIRTGRPLRPDFANELGRLWASDLPVADPFVEV